MEKKVIDCIVIGPNENNFNALYEELKKKKPDSMYFKDMRSHAVEYEGQRYSCHDFMALMLEKKFPNKYLKPDMYDTANMAVYLLTNYLKERNLNVEYINNFKAEKDRLYKLLKDNKVLTVAVTTTFYMDDPPFHEVIKFIRSVNKSVKVIVGGPMVKNLLMAYGHLLRKVEYFYLFNVLKINYFIVEEQGEKTLYDLILAIKNKGDIKKIPNLWFKHRWKIIFTDKQKEDNDINQNIIDWRNYKERLPKVVALRTSIGCTNRCGFCSFRTQKYQLRTVETLKEEFDSLHEAGVKYLMFVDDTINMPTKRFKEILELLIRQKYNFEWTSFLRCTDMDEEMYRLMKESGCKAVSLGVESFNQQVLKNMNKQNLYYDKCVEYLNKYGILSFANFVVGFPGETKDSVEETTVKFMQNPTHFYCPLVFGNHAGTYVHQERQKFGLTDRPFKWSHDTMDYVQAHHAKEKMIIDIDNSYLSPWYGGNVFNIPYLLSLGASTDLVKKLYMMVGAAIRGNLSGNNLTLDKLMDILD